MRIYILSCFALVVATLLFARSSRLVAFSTNLFNVYFLCDIGIHINILLMWRVLSICEVFSPFDVCKHLKCFNNYYLYLRVIVI